MSAKKTSYNKEDGILFILLASLAAGSLSGLMQLPRTFSILFFFFLITKYRPTKILSKALKFLSFWFAWAAFSLIWSSDFSNGIRELILLLTNFLLFFEIVYYAGRSTNLMKILTLGWCTAFMITATIGVWEILTDNHLSLSSHGDNAYMIADGQYLAHHYASATFVNFNSYVVFICYCVPFILYSYFQSTKLLGKILTILLLLVSVFILFMNASRGGILALAFQVSLFFMPLMFGKGAKGTILGLLIILIAGFCVFWDEISLYITVRSAGTSSFEDEPRYDIWMRALKCFWPTFGIGTGVGSVMASMRSISNPGDVIIPHNAVLEILVQYGVVICFICVRFVLRIFRARKYTRDKYMKALITSSILSLVAILIVDSGYLLSPSFWAFFASLYCIANISTFKSPSYLYNHG